MAGASTGSICDGCHWNILAGAQKSQGVDLVWRPHSRLLCSCLCRFFPPHCVETFPPADYDEIFRVISPQLCWVTATAQVRVFCLSLPCGVVFSPACLCLSLLLSAEWLSWLPLVSCLQDGARKEALADVRGPAVFLSMSQLRADGYPPAVLAWPCFFLIRRMLGQHRDFTEQIMQAHSFRPAR